jgi:hypothetical protein
MEVPMPDRSSLKDAVASAESEIPVRKDEVGDGDKGAAARPSRTDNKVDEIQQQIAALEEYVDALEMIPATEFFRNVVLLALLSKALTIGRAVCALVDADFPAEAFGLSRTLIDIFLTVRYISNKDTEVRARTYAEYYAKVHAEWGEINDKYYPDRKLKTPAFHEEAMRVAERFTSKHAWTGVGGQTRMMAFEEDTIESDEEGQPFKADFDYEVVYFWTSHYVHATVIALEEHACPPGMIFRVRTGQPKQYLTDNALFNVLAFLQRTFIYALRAMREEQPTIMKEVDALLKSYAKA